MAVLPDTTTYASLGGTKANYSPVEDASTDLSADEWNDVINNVAGMSYVTPKAWCRFVSANTSTPTDPASNVHGAVWGNAANVKPTLAYSTTGTYTITWSASQNDFLGEAHTLALFTGDGQAEAASAFYHVQVITNGANVATVYVRDAAGNLVNSTGVTFFVKVY